MSVDKESSYYDVGGIETIEILKAKLTPGQYEGFLLGNILKYSSRANHKGSFERDIQKVVVYSSLLEEHKKEENEQKTDSLQDKSPREEVEWPEHLCRVGILPNWRGNCWEHIGAYTNGIRDN